MKIQLINYSGRNDKNYDVTECSSFGNVMSPDMYDLNIIDLSSEYLWKNDSWNPDYSILSSDNDLKTLRYSIDNSKSTRIICVLPRNILFRTESSNSYSSSRLLKDMLDEFLQHLRKIVVVNNVTIFYEKTVTTIENTKMGADFYFYTRHSRVNGEQIINFENTIYSDGSKKLVSYTTDRYTLTTLQFEDSEALNKYLNRIYRDDSEEEYPQWFEEINFFDDNIQKEAIETEERQIVESKQKIELAQENLKENKHFESILFKTGQTLEEILVSMLKEMFDVNSEFIDTKDEDFSFEKNGIHYLFEFKGLTKDVKKSNISQLTTHAYKYAERNKIADDSIKRIIIVTRYKDRAPKDRLPISHNVIEVAKNSINNVLIIDTVQFLKMFEKYRSGELSSEQCLELFNGIGLLEGK
ncbi:hypothetical protein SMU26_01556 [Streptococcus mutans 3SN1]|uniref:hypothetical protein n=1 Tax=Streptococcus mutans TaxID=1309 RepID=UPI0002B4F515|nr:hypothetical protein [Streptococcus mutans]EMB67738.1 hypothetical protein SMU26_01556 [Streptococcus mutans 3SN1]